MCIIVIPERESASVDLSHIKKESLRLMFNGSARDRKMCVLHLWVRAGLRKSNQCLFTWVTQVFWCKNTHFYRHGIHRWVFHPSDIFPVCAIKITHLICVNSCLTSALLSADITLHNLLLCFSLPQDWWFTLTSKDSNYNCSLSGGCAILGRMSYKCVQIMNLKHSSQVS